MKLVVRRHPRFEGVFWVEGFEGLRPATRNLVPGFQVYGEELIQYEGVEYRVWNPFRSKLAAAVVKDVREIFIKHGHRVLYLGSASGTTLSHVSDIVGVLGMVYGVDFSPKVMQQFIRSVVERRRNVVPVLADATKPETYSHIVGVVDVVYADVAQPRQAKLVADNCRLMLKKGGGTLLAVKARSIDSVEEPAKVVEQEVKTLAQNGFEILQTLSLEPFEKDHVMVVAVYHG
ncbi:MAG: fibrillarin-like rRNA/tRNA 2'-O-methyltransferase [Candidatus Caldarchaeum sp.]|nr:fibrillarin-like rRNA/tRNA 2'-O-methyltransferase [Candidatus Caldarchaeum sp.]